MPIEITDCDGGIGVIIAGHGIISDQEYINSLRGHLTQGKVKFSKYKFSLSDFTEVTKVQVTNDAIDIVVQMCIAASIVNPHPIVAMAGEDDFVFGLERMIEVLMSDTNWEIMVFRSTKKAKEWIRERVNNKFGIDDLTFR